MKIEIKDCEDAVRCYFYKGQMYMIDEYLNYIPW